jgi:hypothetical protein
MSDLGLFLLLFVALFVLVGIIRFFSWLTQLQEQHGSLPHAGAHAIQRYVVVRPVNDYEDDRASHARVMSRAERQTGQTDDADGDGRRVSVDNPWIERLKVDKSKTALIEVMVYSGWGVDEIRKVVKGENGAIGLEVDAARQRLGIQAPAPYLTPIVGRPTNAKFETDIDFPYQAPA